MRLAKLSSLLIVVALLIPVLSMLTYPSNIISSSQTNHPEKPLFIPLAQSGVVMSGFQAVSSVDSSLPMNVLVTLGFNHQALLNLTLNQLQDPSSPIYHKYLSSSQFISEFSPSVQEYNSYVNYFRSQGLNVTNTYADRVSIGISSNASQLEKVFHTHIMYFSSNKSEFFAPNSPLSINADFGSITGVTGMSDQFKAAISPLFSGSGTSQYLYGADLQTAYQLSKLYQAKGYPTGETVATILWSGTDSGTPVGPFVPSDISTYFSNNLPSGEPRSTFYGVPVGNAPLPGTSAASDTTGANIESTLDLEMAGSTAPGATLVEVYGPEPYMSYLDEAFAEILNPSYNTTVDGALSHVVAISNSWGGGDSYDSAWTQYEQEAAARGITVLASSGDNGNTNSATPSFPATFAYNGYGTLAVGGTQTILSGTQSQDGSGTTGISSQSVWYNTPSAGDGSQGGVSSIYSEPTWQLNSSDANSVITGASSITGLQSGRGTPDIAGVGANMLVYLSSIPNGGTDYYELWGTSIASPLNAGLIATVDSYLGSPEGFLNPFIYEIGQEQFQRIYTGPSPFYFIYNGSNGAFSSEKGYNLVDGWGSINAYNFVIAQEDTHQVTFSEAGLPAGTMWYVNLSDGLTLSSTSSALSLLLPDGSYSYAVSSGLKGYTAHGGTFLVNGASLSEQIVFSYSAYTVRFSESGLPSGEWYVNITGQSARAASGSEISYHLPNGTYSYTVATSYKDYAPSQASGSFTVDGKNITMPEVIFSLVTYRVTFIESGLQKAAAWILGLQGNYYVNDTGTLSLKLPNGTYTYNATSLSGNSYKANGGIFTINGKSLNLSVVFVKYYTLVFTEKGLPTGDKWIVVFDGEDNSSISPDNVSFTAPNGTYSYSIPGLPGYHPSSDSGTLKVIGANITMSVIFVPTTYNVVFSESGLPAGSEWYVNFTSGAGSNSNLRLASSSNSVNAALPNGTYSYFVSTGDKIYEAQGSSFTVNGYNVYQSIYFTPIKYRITFLEEGLPTGTSWNISTSGTTYRSFNSTIVINESNGTYTYNVIPIGGYHLQNSTGTFTVLGNPLVIVVTFSANTYNISFYQYNLPRGTRWWINFTNNRSFSTTGVQLNLSMPNGTYYFSLASQNKSWVSSNYYMHLGEYEIIVNGGGFTYYFSFTPMAYNITFIASGLQPGTEWFGYLVDSYVFSDTYGKDLNAFIVNGTYQVNFTAIQFGVEYTQPSIKITVNGHNESYNVTFHRYYTASFNEVGVPVLQSYQEWEVVFNGSSYYGTLPSLNVTVLNGIYKYVLLGTGNYYPVQSTGYCTVNGSNVSLYVKYSEYSFIMANIVPTNASVYIDGVQVNTSNGYFNISVVPGQYEVVVSENGYFTYYVNVTTQSGKSTELQVNLVSYASVKGNEIAVDIGISLAILIPFASAVYYFKKMRRK